MCLVVVTVADVGCSDEEFKRVVLIQIQCARFNLLLQLPHALLPIAVSYILRNKVISGFPYNKLQTLSSLRGAHVHTHLLNPRSFL